MEEGHVSASAKRNFSLETRGNKLKIALPTQCRLVLLRKKHRLLLVQRIYPRMVVGTRGEKHPISGADVGAQWLHHRRGEPGRENPCHVRTKSSVCFYKCWRLRSQAPHETCLQSDVLLVAGSASSMKMALTLAYRAVPYRAVPYRAVPCRTVPYRAVPYQAFTAPSVGFCKAHSAPQHSCYMYSVSDDRYLKVR